MRNKLALSLISMLLTFAAAVTNAQTLPKYKATVVGSAPFSPSCFISVLSDTGVMAGACDPYGSYAGGIVVWRNGVATSYGKLPKGTYAEAHAINSMGVVAGDADTGDGRPHTYVTYKGALLQMKDSGANDRAIGITDGGVIFGNVIKGFDSPWTAAFWAPEAGKPDRYRMTMLPFYNDGGDPASLSSALQGSNKAGQAVGWINGSDNGQWGGFWNNDAAHTVAPLRPLADGNHSIAYSVNDLGQAVGESNSGMIPMRAVLWQNDAAHTVVDLGTLPGDTISEAMLINNAGQIVGFSATGMTNGVSRMFFYQNGTMVDLNSLVDQSNGTLEITSVMALNNAGQMIAGGRLNGQVTFNILLTPIQ